MTTGIFRRKPWTASICLSCLCLSCLTAAHFLGASDISDAFIVVLFTYGLFYFLAYKNIGHSQTLRPYYWPRIFNKSLVLVLQILLIILFAQIFESWTHFYVYSVFVSQIGILIPLIILTPLYVAWVDVRMPEPEDEYARLGAWIRAPRQIDTGGGKKSFIIKTIVKIIFVPFMFGGIIGNCSILLNTRVLRIDDLSLLIYNVVITIDMVVGAFGYLFSSAILDNQIKDTDKNFLGWLFCLLCYPPLVWISAHVNHQYDHKLWTDFMQPNGFLYWIFFVVLNGLWIIYLCSSFSFGMSFSNLSWRYLIDYGVFRYTKHPAYIAKNLYWWLSTLPFLGVPWFSAPWWGNMLGLTFTSLVYYGRAKSEERHLSQFSEYRAYSEYIAREGIFRWLNRDFWRQKRCTSA